PSRQGARNVATPLRAPWREGLRVSELVGDGRALVRPAVLAQRNERASLDRLGDPGRDVDLSREYPEVNWDYASIERIDPRTHEASVIDFDLGRAVFARDPAHDHLLQPGDQVTVYARADFEQPAARRTRLVRVEGEVNRPGIFSAPAGARLSDVLGMAGGLTGNAYVYGSRLLRASARKQEETRIREAIARVEQDYYRRIATRSQGVVAQEDAMMAGAELEAVRTLIARLRQYKAEGRVTLDLPGRRALGADLPDLTVEDEDVLVVPARPSTVTVAGAVVQAGSLLWRENAAVEHYLTRSGGMRRFADRDGIVVMHADGSVQLARGGLWHSTAVEPGDTIFVPEDVETVTTMRAIKDWTTILYQFGLGAVALKVLGGL
nr:SLBB domain-containing protein [Piscinibacter sp.]